MFRRRNRESKVTGTSTTTTPAPVTVANAPPAMTPITADPSIYQTNPAVPNTFSTNPYVNRSMFSPLLVGQKMVKGDVPTNLELNSILDSAKRVINKESQGTNYLSPQANQILQDIYALVEDMQMILLQKNSDEKWQGFWRKYVGPNAIQGTKQIAEQVRSGQPGAKMAQYTTQVRSTAYNFGGLISLIVSSSEFRSLLLDLVRFVKDVTQREFQKRDTNITQSLKEEMEAPTDKNVTQTAKETGSRVARMVRGVTDDILKGNVPIDENQKRLIIQRFRETLRRLAQEPKFHRAINSLFALIDNMKQESFNVVSNLQNSQTPTGQNTGMMWTEFSRIIGDFVGFRYIDRLNADLRSLFQEMKNDYETNRWFSELRSFIEESLRRPESLETDENLSHAEDLWNQGRHVGLKWKNHDLIQKTSKDLTKLFSKFAKDPLVVKTLQDVQKLTSDTFIHPTGGISITNTIEGIRALRYLLVPLLVDQFENLPLPRIEGSSRKYSYVFDNMVLAGRSILPENIDVQVLSDNKVNLAAEPNTRTSFELIMTLSNLNLFMKDVAFFIHKKRGFPKIKDEGLLDVSVAGGINFLVLRWVIQADRGRPLYFRLANVTSNITRVKPTFTSAKHKGMMNAMTSLSAGALRKRVNFTIEERIIAFFDKLDARLNEMAAMRWENSRVSWLKRPLKVPKTTGLFKRGEKKEKVKNKIGRKARETGIVGATSGMEQGISAPPTSSTSTTAPTSTAASTSFAPTNTTTTPAVDLGHAQPHVFVGSGTPTFDANKGLHIVPQRSLVVSTAYNTTDEVAPVTTSPSSSFATQSTPIQSEKQLVSRPSEIDIGNNASSVGTGNQPIPSTSDVPSSGSGGVSSTPGIVVESPRAMQKMTQEPIKTFGKQEDQPVSSFQVAPSSSS